VWAHAFTASDPSLVQPYPHYKLDVASHGYRMDTGSNEYRVAFLVPCSFELLWVPDMPSLARAWLLHAVKIMLRFQGSKAILTVFGAMPWSQAMDLLIRSGDCNEACNHTYSDCHEKDAHGAA
jgi:hypothetical protein